MRITHDVLQERWMADLQKRLSAVDLYTRRIGSGKSVERPSDDPVGASRVMQLDEVVKRNDQYLKNIEEAIQFNATTESVLDQVFARITRAKELTIEGSNTASLPDAGTLDAFSEEIKGIKEGVADLALTQYQGHYIFNGTAGSAAPYGQDGGAYLGDRNMLALNLGNGQSVPMNLTGDRAFRETEIRSGEALFANGDVLSLPPGETVSFTISDGLGVDTNVTLSDGMSVTATLNAAFAASGANLTSSLVDGQLSIRFVDSSLGGEMAVSNVSGDLEGTLGITAGVKNVFGLLDDLKVAMDSNDLQEVSRFLGRVDRFSDSLGNQRGQYGSRARNLEFARDRIETYSLNSTTLKEKVEGIDLPETVTKYTAQEQAYQTALAAGARIFNVSILDFLR